MTRQYLRQLLGQHSEIEGVAECQNGFEVIERIDRIEPYTKDRYLAILKDGARLKFSRSGHKRLKQVLGD